MLRTSIVRHGKAFDTAMNDLAEPVDTKLRQSITLTLRTWTVQAARSLDINLGAMASYGAFVERDGLLLGDIRTF